MLYQLTFQINLGTIYPDQKNRVIMSMGPGLGGEEVVLGGAEGGPPGPLAQEAWQGHQLEDQEVGGDI